MDVHYYTSIESIRFECSYYLALCLAFLNFLLTTRPAYKAYLSDSYYLLSITCIFLLFSSSSINSLYPLHFQLILTKH